MTSVLNRICDWATGLPYWEQAALNKILSGSTLAEADIEELVRYMLEDETLVPQAGPHPNLDFEQFAKGISQSGTPKKLLRISGLQNINALVTGQTLTFGPALTVIYGGNGSGKSGYARVLGCAGFTRGDREILPDIGRPLNANAVLSAKIEVQDGTSTREIQYLIGRPCSELSSFYVFDSTSVRVHLTKSNSISFSPAGLSCLTRLAEVTDQVRERLATRVQSQSQPHNFGPLFIGGSEVSQLVASLGLNSDMARLQALATITPAELARIKEMDIQIARLKATDIPAKLIALEKTSSDLQSFADKLQKAEDGLSDQAVSDIRKAIAALASAQAAARDVSIDKFKSDKLLHTGSDAWRQFVQAARALAELEQTPEAPYPQPESVCLLCQQPLSAQARDLLVRLWAFLQSDAQDRIHLQEKNLSAKRRQIEDVDLAFFDDQSVARRHLEERGRELVSKVTNWIAQCLARRVALLKAIDKRSMPDEIGKLDANPSPDIRQVIHSVNTERTTLKLNDPSEQISKLEAQLQTLRHRVVLSEHISQIQEYVSKCIWADRASRIGGSTRHITDKHNDIFRDLVTDRYIALFQQTLSQFGRHVRAQIITSGRKGETYKQILVERHPSVPSDKAVPDRVLSEGEKRAVALADFLTEVALDTTCGGIILDDPVTSLDLEWGDLIARLLADEAGKRQVVVFTHDLPFLHLVKSRAEQANVQTVTHWIRRGENDDRPGYVFLDNSPALERDYRKPTRAREICAKAKNAPPAQLEAMLRDGFGALRTTYEAFIIFELLNEVVMRFSERISFGRLNEIVWDRALVREVVEKCEALSRYIEGHLHSDQLSAPRPTCDLLLSEIETFEGLSKKLKDIRKACP